MGKLAKALGMGFVIEHKGKRYKFASLDRTEVQGAFENYLEDYGLRRINLLIHRNKLKESEAEDHRRQFQHDVVAGSYSFGTDIFMTAMHSGKHQTELLRLMAEADGTDMTLDLLDEIVADHEEDVVLKMFGTMLPEKKRQELEKARAERESQSHT